MMSSAQIPVMIGSDKATQTIIAPVQHDLIAAQAYAVGDLFIFNNGLYKVTTAIAQGGTITIGTNCQPAPTLAEELIQRVDDIPILRSGIQAKTLSVAQGTTSATFTFDAIPNATINAIIPISFYNIDTYAGITGYIVSGIDVNQRTVSLRILGTISAQNVTCKVVILYTLTS